MSSGIAVEAEPAKICKTCGFLKPPSDYYRNASNNDGRFGTCIACIREKQRAYDRDKRLRRRASRLGVAVEDLPEAEKQARTPVELRGCSHHPKSKGHLYDDDDLHCVHCGRSWFEQCEDETYCPSLDEPA